MVSREDAFNKSAAMHRERTNRRGGNFENPQFGALETNEYRAFRLLGMPPDSRIEPTDANFVNLSLILGDDDRKFRVIWPDRHEHDNWFLWKIYNRVMAYDWNPAEKQRNYHHATKHPSVFNRVHKNNHLKNPYEKGWTPSQLVAMNVIDRTQMGWHRENRHTVLWSRKASESGGKVYYDSGVPITLYGSIIDDMIENYGDWELYDIIALKLDKDPWYKVYHGVDDMNKITIAGTKEITSVLSLDEKKRIESAKRLLTPEMQAMMAAPLTDEEQSWERYDLTKLFPITSMAKIYKKLKHFIQQVDESFGTAYFDELESLVAKEEAGKKEAVKNEEPIIHDGEEVTREKKTQVVVEKPVPKPESIEEVKVEETKVRTRKAPAKKDGELTFEDLIVMGYKGIENLTAEEKSQIITIKPDGSFKYVNGSDIYKCSDPKCEFKAPGSFTHCPKCNFIFEDEE